MSRKAIAMTPPTRLAFRRDEIYAIVQTCAPSQGRRRHRKEQWTETVTVDVMDSPRVNSNSNMTETIQITTVRALQDNLCYLLSRSDSNRAVLIDPSETKSIRKALAQRGLSAALILNTHHHHDHVGGNVDLQKEFGAPIWCSKTDINRVPGAERGLIDGEIFFFEGIQIEIMEIPGHTQGQIAFYIPESGAIFVGDTLFAMGCGRLFEGTAAQMWTSLLRLMKLPPETRIYFGHEYTERNAAFARTVDPENPAINERLIRVREELRSASGLATAPTLAEEYRVNPFLRAGESFIREQLGMPLASDLQVFTRLREMRDVF
jgi:hydroxyacylglutathione hydrolase